MSQQNTDRLRSVTSRQNNLVKDLRHAFTQAELTDDGHCAIEGSHIIEEAIRSGLKVKAVFFSESAKDRANRLLPQLGAQTETILVPDDVFKSAVPTETPQGVAALVKLKPSSLEDILECESPFILGAAGVQDPGNLGTMIRSAEAFGAAGLVTTEKTVSAINWKVIRASAGSIFRLPVVKVNSVVGIAAMKARGIRMAATSSHKGPPLHEIDLRGGICVFIGSEGAGVPKEILANVGQTIAIPHSSNVESLNAGIAASLVVYEMARQKLLKK